VTRKFATNKNNEKMVQVKNYIYTGHPSKLAQSSLYPGQQSHIHSTMHTQQAFYTAKLINAI